MDQGIIPQLPLELYPLIVNEMPLAELYHYSCCCKNASNIAKERLIHLKHLYYTTLKSSSLLRSRYRQICPCYAFEGLLDNKTIEYTFTYDKALKHFSLNAILESYFLADKTEQYYFKVSVKSGTTKEQTAETASTLIGKFIPAICNLKYTHTTPINHVSIDFVDSYFSTPEQVSITKAFYNEFGCKLSNT